MVDRWEWRQRCLSLGLIVQEASLLRRGLGSRGWRARARLLRVSPPPHKRWVQGLSSCQCVTDSDQVCVRGEASLKTFVCLQQLWLTALPFLLSHVFVTHTPCRMWTHGSFWQLCCISLKEDAKPHAVQYWEWGLFQPGQEIRMANWYKYTNTSGLPGYWPSDILWALESK